jgi:hypothetical protein
MPRLNVHWQDASTPTYTAESITVNGYTLSVCLDDEGPMRPAYYWDITHDDDKATDGWASSVAHARRDGLNDLARLV